MARGGLKCKCGTEENDGHRGGGQEARQLRGQEENVAWGVVRGADSPDALTSSGNSAACPGNSPSPALSTSHVLTHFIVLRLWDCALSEPTFQTEVPATEKVRGLRGVHGWQRDRRGLISQLLHGSTTGSRGRIILPLESFHVHCGHPFKF